AGVAQWPQLLTDLVMKVRRARFVDAQLYDRNVGFWKNVAQHRPGAVIESPAIVEIDVERCEQLLHFPRQRWVAGRRILDGKQLAREPAKVMNRARRGHRGDRELRHVPMRRNA